jgi:2-dehydropantoate 2-reductase
VDIVFLGLKAYSYAAAGPLLAPLLRPGTGVVAAQNGIPWWYFHGLSGPHEGGRVEAADPGGAVSAVIPPDRAIGCVVYCSAEIEAPGVIRHVEGTRFSIGEPDGSVSERCAAFSAAMTAGGLKCPVEKDLRSDIWLKLLGNVAFNPVSVLTGATMGQIAAHPGTRQLVLAMMHETAGIAARLGSPPKISVERRFDGAARVGDHKTSMLMDFEAGKPLETDVLLKAPIELAHLVGVPAPSLEMVGALIDLLARPDAA